MRHSPKKLNIEGMSFTAVVVEKLFAILYMSIALANCNSYSITHLGNLATGQEGRVFGEEGGQVQKWLSGHGAARQHEYLRAGSS